MTIQHAIKVLVAEDAVWDSAAQKLVLIELAYRADRRGVVRMTQTEIATLNALNRRTVARSFVLLESVGVIERIGHGRYRLITEAFDALADHLTQVLSQPEGATEELDRLKAIRQPHQGIAYNNDGWPVLVDKTDFEHGEGESESEEDASS